MEAKSRDPRRRHVVVFFPLRPLDLRFSSFAYSQEAGAVLSAHATAVNSLSSVSISSHRQLIFLYLTEQIGTGKLTYHSWVFVSLCHAAVIVGGLLY